MIPPVLQFRPNFRSKVWGGRRLQRLGRRLPPDIPIGEAWEIADLPGVPDGQTVITGGPLDGMTLHEAIGKHRDAILGDVAGRAFPLLIKYLDARENLSIQVHPRPAYAKRHPETHVKSECWYIIEAEQGARIYAGVKPGIDRDTFAAHVREGSPAADLNQIEVKPGDCFCLPSGLCHALGAGIVVAEVQMPGDTTFRLHDWGRSDRALHLEQALEAMDIGLRPIVSPVTRGAPADGLAVARLCECEHFVLERLECEQDATVPIETEDKPLVWMVLEGAGAVEHAPTEPTPTEATPTEATMFRSGTTLLFPAATSASHATCSQACTVLRVSIPERAE